MSKLLGLLGELVEMIFDAVRNNVSDKEIRERLASPNGVGQKLIDAARSTQTKLDDYVRNG